jgi:hypothetical protein
MLAPSWPDNRLGHKRVAIIVTAGKEIGVCWHGCCFTVIVIFCKRHMTSHSRTRSSASKNHYESGLTLVEVAVSVALLGLVFATVLGTLIILNRNAASTRLMTNVREIVQRNIEAAVGVPFTTTNVPSILAITTSSGVAWDEGIAGNNPVSIYTSRDATTSITGTLLRIVTAEPNSLSADIRRVTFRLSYTFYGRNLSYELATIRAKDQ